MIYEFKTYRATPGSIAALIKRFNEKTMPIFARLGIEVQYCWTSDEEPDAFFYLVGYASEEAKKAASAAFSADPEWQLISGDSLYLRGLQPALVKAWHYINDGRDRN